MKYSLVAAIALACVAGAVAECPNACSGHGTCGTNDMCACYRNWQASDCSERTCPYGWSFVTSPQGDLNFDGDRFDNSFKPIVFKSDTTINGATATAGTPILANVAQLSDQLIFNADIATGELVVGDCIFVELVTTSAGVTTTTPKKFCISAVSANSPATTFTLDAPNDAAAQIADAVVYKFLENIPRPQGTWESWPGHATSAYSDEGHFYMECSNKGLCDRASGQCMCFEGYEGFACSRTTCPSGCSGHGTCMSVKELSVASPNRLAFGGDVTEGSSFVATTSTPVGTLAAGDKVFLGEQASAEDFREGNLYTVGLVQSSGFDITPPARNSLRFGATLYHAASYKLWDADKNHACKCDAGYVGHACAERSCPAGADPLDVTGEDFVNTLSTTSAATPSYFTRTTESQTLDLDTSCGTLAGSFSLVHTDQVTGERTATREIEVNPELSSTVSVIEPETAAGDSTYCTSLVQKCYKKVTFTPHLPQYELSVGDFIRVGREYRQIAAVNTDSSSGNYSFAWVNEAFEDNYAAGTFAYRLNAVNSIEKALEGLPNGAVVDATVSRRVGGTQLSTNFASGTASNAGSTVYNGAIGSYSTGTPGSDTLTFASASATSGTHSGTAVAGNVYLVGTEYVKYDGSAYSRGNFLTEAAGDGSAVAISAQFAESPVSPAQVCVGDLVGTNNYASSASSPEYLRQVDGTIKQAGGVALTGAGSAGYVGFKTQRLCGVNGPVDTDNNYAPYATHTCDGVAPSSRTPIMRLSGARYEIQTDVDGDPTELVCKTSNLHSVYVASSGGYVSRSSPRTVSFIDHRFGSNQPSLRPLSADGSLGDSHPEALARGDVIYVGNNKCVIASVEHSGHRTTGAANRGGADVANIQGGGLGSVTCTEDLQPTSHSTADAIAVNEPVLIEIQGASQSCMASDYRALRFQVQDSSRANQATVSVSQANVAGDNRKVANSADSSAAFLDLGDISIGDRVMIETAAGKYETRTIDSIDTGNTYFTVSSGFSAAHSAKRIWVVGKGSKSQHECAGRGLCDDTTGDCVCFRGYTKQACEEQSALAA